MSAEEIAENSHVAQMGGAIHHNRINPSKILKNHHFQSVQDRDKGMIEDACEIIKDEYDVSTTNDMTDLRSKKLASMHRKN